MHEGPTQRLVHPHLPPRLRSHGVQTDLPYASAAHAEAKVYFRVVHGERVLQFKLGWQCPLQILFAKIDVRADFVWHGIVLDESLSPQHYNMLPGEENTATLHLVRAEHRSTTHQEDILISDSVRAMGLRLRLEEERCTALQRENDELQGQVYALHRELADVNAASSRMLDDARTAHQATVMEKQRLVDEVERLRAELQRLAAAEAAAAEPQHRAPHAQRCNTPPALETPAMRTGAGSATHETPMSSRTPSSTAQGRGSHAELRRPRTAVAASPRAQRATPRASRDSEIASLRHELGSWQNSVRKSVTARSNAAQPVQQVLKAGTSTLRDGDGQHLAAAREDAQLATSPGSETLVKCVLLNEHDDTEQHRLPPLRGPPNATLSIGDALEMLRQRHGPLIPPMTALMCCVQRCGAAGYDVVDVHIAPKLQEQLANGDTLFVANMAT